MIFVLSCPVPRTHKQTNRNKEKYQKGHGHLFFSFSELYVLPFLFVRVCLLVFLKQMRKPSLAAIALGGELDEEGAGAGAGAGASSSSGADKAGKGGGCCTVS